MCFNRIVNLLRSWWQRFTMSPTERWLSQSSDVVELESRLRQLWGYSNQKFTY